MEGRPLEKSARRDVWASAVRAFDFEADEELVLPKDYNPVAAWAWKDEIGFNMIRVVATRKKRVPNDAA